MGWPKKKRFGAPSVPKSQRGPALFSDPADNNILVRKRGRPMGFKNKDVNSKCPKIYEKKQKRLAHF